MAKKPTPPAANKEAPANGALIAQEFAAVNQLAAMKRDIEADVVALGPAVGL